ncbi:MAG: FAD-dependent oxidoreductase, partial [Spirochaetota bacterium]
MAIVTIKINDQEVQVESGSTILQAAIRAGYDIPTFCHSENLKPFTSCFICAVKIDGGKGNLVPSCATKVNDGMSVTVESDEILKSRRMCLNLLLSDHYGDCIPPCEDACPASIDIKGFMELTAQGREAEAALLIREKAPVPGILGRICPRPCETVCRRTRVDEPLSICFMKRHISDTEISLKGGPVLPQPEKDTGKKIAVVGAGPAGMTAAYFLRLHGHSVTVFEAKSQSGGMLRYGIPFYRLPEHVLMHELGAIEKIGVTVRYNTSVGKDVTAKELEKEFDCLILAIGAQGASPMRIKGEDLPGVYPGIEYLSALASGSPPDIGQKVIIVGGGNTAIDVARSAIRAGAEAVILYRRTRKEMPANDFEIDEALH